MGYRRTHTSDPADITVNVVGGGPVTSSATAGFENEVTATGALDAVESLSQNSVTATNITEVENLSANSVTATSDLELENTSRNSVTASNSTSFEFTGLEPAEDTFLNEQGGTLVYGNSSNMLAKNDTADGVIDNDQNTYIAWDLTNINATITSMTVRIYCSENAAVGGVTASYQWYTHPTQPIDEGTDTWDNTEQPPGTLRQSSTFSVNSATPTLITLTPNSTVRNNADGNWVYLRITGTSDGLGTNTITTRSKESTDEPEMDIIATL